MKVTEEALVEIIVTLEIRTVNQIRKLTGAGDGCMACRWRLQRYVDEYSTSAQSAAAIPLAMAG